jgi:hypothetical protein
MAVGSSTIWEFIGEWKEMAAINDLIVTPVAGAALSEPFLQIGALMHRSRQNTGTRIFGWVFAPIKSIHDRMDGLDPKQVDHVDDLGLPAEEWHRFRVGASIGVTQQEKGLTQSDGRLRLESQIVALPDYYLAGERDGWFDAGEVSEISATGTINDQSKIVDANVAASFLPFGYRWQDVRMDRDGDLRGSSIITGFDVGMEYGTHDYDRDGRRGIDRLGIVSGGASLEHLVHLGRGVSLRSRVDILGDFAGVDAYALPEYTRDFGDLRLSSVLRNQHYYHAYGATVHPRIELLWARLDASIDFRADYFEEITGNDVNALARFPESAAHDRRLWTRSDVGYHPAKPIRMWLGGEHRNRDGSMPGASASRSEVTGLFGVDLQF